MDQEVSSAAATSRRRGVILMAALSISMAAGLLYAFSIFIIPLEASFGWSRQEISFTFSLVLVFFSLGMLTSGNVMARLGPGNTALLGGLLAAVGFFLASFTINLYMLYVAYGIMAGYGLGLANLMPLTVLMDWYPERRGLISGLVAMSLALGTFVLGSLLAGQLVRAYGWAFSFRALAAVFLLAVAGGSRFLKMPPPGWRPPNWSPAPGQGQLWGYSRRNMLKTRAIWLFCAWLVFIQFGGLMIFGHVAAMTQDLGFSAQMAGLAVGVQAIANGLGRLFFGWLNDHCNLRKAMTLNVLFMSGGLLGLIFLPPRLDFVGLALSVALVGAGYGGSVPHSAIVAGRFFGPKYFAQNYGLTPTPGAIGAGLIAPPLGGYILSLTGAYNAAILSAAALTAGSLIISLILKPPPRRCD